MKICVINYYSIILVIRTIRIRMIMIMIIYVLLFCFAVAFRRDRNVRDVYEDRFPVERGVSV